MPTEWQAVATLFSITLLDYGLLFVLPFPQLLLFVWLYLTPCLSLTSALSTVNWMGQRHQGGPAATVLRLACGSSLAFLVFTGLLYAFRGTHNPFVSLLLLFVILQVLRLAGAACATVPLAILGTIFGPDRLSAAAAGLASTAGLLLLRKMSANLLGLDGSELWLLAYLTLSCAYALMWGGCVHAALYSWRKA